MAATPRDLKQSFWVGPAPAGSWVELEGQARGAKATFLYDTASGGFSRAAVVDWRGPAISRDGKRAAWIEGRSGGGPLEAITMSLDESKAKPVRTRLSLPSYPALLVLSADGSLLATMDGEVLSIHDLASARTLASARIGEDRADVRGLFTDDGLFRVYRRPGNRTGRARLEILELAVASKTLRQTGEFTHAGGDLFFVASRNGDRIVAIRYSNKETWLLDGRTGAMISRLAEGASETSRWAGFLADGRVVLSERSGQTARLRIVLPDGVQERVIPLPQGRFVALGGEVAPGKIVVAVWDGSTYFTHLVDIGAGSVRKIADGLFPVARLSGLASDEVGAGPEVGSEATKLFLRSGAELVRLDPLTGDQRVILGASRTGQGTGPAQ
jgi:hypothetical protein